MVGVAEVGLDGPQRAKLAPAGVTAKRLGQALDFDRVSQSGARPVRLDEGQLIGVDAGVLPGAVDHVGLRIGVRRRDAGGGAVLVHRRAPQNGVYGVARRQRVIERLQQESDAGFPAARAGRIVVEGPRAPVGRFDLGARMPPEGQQMQFDRAGQRHFALARSQRIHGQRESGKRRRAGRIHQQRRTPQIQQVGDAAGRHRRRERFQKLVRVGGAGGFEYAAKIGAAHAFAQEYAGASALETRGRVTRIFDGVPGGFQEQLLARVELRGLLRRHPEMREIEFVHLVQVRHLGGFEVGGFEVERRGHTFDVWAARLRQRAHKVVSAIQFLP